MPAVIRNSVVLLAVLGLLAPAAAMLCVGCCQTAPVPEALACCVKKTTAPTTAPATECCCDGTLLETAPAGFTRALEVAPALVAAVFPLGRPTNADRLRKLEHGFHVVAERPPDRSPPTGHTVLLI